VLLQPGAKKLQGIGDGCLPGFQIDEQASQSAATKLVLGFVLRCSRKCRHTHQCLFGDEVIVKVIDEVLEEHSDRFPTESGGDCLLDGFEDLMKMLMMNVDLVDHNLSGHWREFAQSTQRAFTSRPMLDG
jgi:hypothetical protein